MESLLIRERYKVIRVLAVEPDFAAMDAVDIQSRDKDEYLLNVYEGGLLKKYVRCFSKLEHCPEFAGLFTTEGALVALFARKRGKGIDEVFFRGADPDWKMRVEYAQLLFHSAISVANYPPEVSCAAFLSENICLRPDDCAMSINYIVRPMEGLTERELVLLLTDQIEKVLLRRYASPWPELDLLERLKDGTVVSAAAAYALWLEKKPLIQAEYGKVEKMPEFSRMFYLFFKFLGRRFKRKKAPRKGGR